MKCWQITLTFHFSAWIKVQKRKKRTAFRIFECFDLLRETDLFLFWPYIPFYLSLLQDMVFCIVDTQAHLIGSSWTGDRQKTSAPNFCPYSGRQVLENLSQKLYLHHHCPCWLDVFDVCFWVWIGYKIFWINLSIKLHEEFILNINTNIATL